MICSLVTAVAIFLFTPLGAEEYEGVRLLIIVAVSTGAWLAVTMLSPPTAEESLMKFYERVRPGGLGWRAIEEKFGLTSARTGARDIFGAISGAAFIYMSLFALGKLLLGFPSSAWVPLAVAALATGALMIVFLREKNAISES